MIYKIVVSAVITMFFLCSMLNAQSTPEKIFSTLMADELFPTPDILKDKVEFWKKIYSKYTLNDGVIHDRDYPSIIYKEILNDGRVSAIRKEKENIIVLIKNINTLPESAWTQKERDIVEMFRKYASVELIKDAEERIRYQQGQSDRFREGLVRSGMYIDTIRSILKEYGVPERLAYLPHVESSFNTAAYSKVGAAGLWQFMRGTGKLYGMKITYTIDERRDPIIATRGAARYLSTAYSELKAWPLAITSYNHGIAGMKRAVNSTGSRDLGYIIQNYESRSFKFASSNFYGCFLAASEIAMNMKEYFPALKVAARLDFSDLTLTHFVRPDVLCNYLKLSKEQLIALNPAIRAAVFEQHAKLPVGLKIHIPSSLSETAYAMIAAIPDSLQSDIADRSQYYKVDRGDNLIGIASRLGVSVQELALENNLSRKSKIMIGQLLRVPQVKPAQKAAVAVAAASQVQMPPEKAASPVVSNTEALIEIAQNEIDSKLAPEEKKLVQVAKAESPKKKEKEIPAKVKETSPVDYNQDTAPALVEVVADTLKEIAIAQAVESKTEKVNERPGIQQANFDIGIYNLDVNVSPVGTSAEIMVSIDETIGHYADWLGIATWKIRKINNMGRGSDIRINKRLIIPVEQEDMIDRFIEARLQYHMAIEEDFYSQYKVSDVKSRIIKRNETLWDICSQSDNENALPLWLFRKYNKHLDLNTLVPGTTIWIPQISEKTAGDIVNDGSQESPGYYYPYVQPIRADNRESKRLP